ncbi:MAG: hypothetical protein IPM56_07540 [Ignavibacteriales bacterium]|nr:MAG: hypothetical protein IPM56_07540 [Ignavibacteriales bacterium]
MKEIIKSTFKSGLYAMRIKLYVRVLLKLFLFFLGLYLTAKFAILMTGLFFNK